MSDTTENRPVAESDVSYQAVRWALYEAPNTNSPVAKAVLVVLAEHWYEQPVYPSIKRIAEALEISERSVQRALRLLEKIDLITPVMPGSGRTSTAYTINIPATRGDTQSPLGCHSVTSGVTESHPNKRVEEDIRKRNNITSSSILGRHTVTSRTNSFSRQPDLEELPPAPEPTCAAPPAGMVPNLSDYTKAQIDNPGIWFTNHSGQRIPKFVEQPKSVRRY